MFFVYFELTMGRRDTQYNDTQNKDIPRNETKHNDTKHNDTQHTDTQYNDIQHNDIQHKNTKHCDIQHNSKLWEIVVMLHVVMLIVMAPTMEQCLFIFYIITVQQNAA